MQKKRGNPYGSKSLTQNRQKSAQSSTIGSFGKFFDFLPGERSTRFIDVIKQVKPVEVRAFGLEASEVTTNINTKG